MYNSPRRNVKDRKPIARTQSAPHRRYTKHAMKRQTSSEDLPTVDHEPGMEINQPHITSPKTVSAKRNCDEMRPVAIFTKITWQCFFFTPFQKNLLIYVNISTKMSNCQRIICDQLELIFLELILLTVLNVISEYEHQTP